MKWKEPSRACYQIVREGAQRGFFLEGTQRDFEMKTADVWRSGGRGVAESDVIRCGRKRSALDS